MNNYREMYEVLLQGKMLTSKDARLMMGENGEIFNHKCETVHIQCLKPSDWSIKPKTVNINSFEVPEPIREPLKEGEDYWLVNMDDESGFMFKIWRNSKIENFWLSKGMIHRRKEAAVLHTKALWSFTAKGGV